MCCNLHQTCRSSLSGCWMDVLPAVLHPLISVITVSCHELERTWHRSQVLPFLHLPPAEALQGGCLFYLCIGLDPVGGHRMEPEHEMGGTHPTSWKCQMLKVVVMHVRTCTSWGKEPPCVRRDAFYQIIRIGRIFDASIRALRGQPTKGKKVTFAHLIDLPGCVKRDEI